MHADDAVSAINGSFNLIENLNIWLMLNCAMGACPPAWSRIDSGEFKELTGGGAVYRNSYCEKNQSWLRSQDGRGGLIFLVKASL